MKYLTSIVFAIIILVATANANLLTNPGFEVNVTTKTTDLFNTSAPLNVWSVTNNTLIAGPPRYDCIKTGNGCMYVNQILPRVDIQNGFQQSISVNDFSGARSCKSAAVFSINYRGFTRTSNFTIYLRALNGAQVLSQIEKNFTTTEVGQFQFNWENLSITAPIPSGTARVQVIIKAHTPYDMAFFDDAFLDILYASSNCVPKKLPDLVITNFSVDYITMIGGWIYADWAATQTNVGSVATTASITTYTDLHGISYELAIPSLAPGESIELHPWNFGEVTECVSGTMRLELDSHLNVSESNEANNHFSTHISCP